MDIFRTLVIAVAITVFIGLFTFTAFTFYDNTPQIAPPDMTSCPDFWNLRPDGTCMIPKIGEHNLGSLKYKGHIMYEYIFNNDENRPKYSSLSKFYDSNNQYQGSSKKKIIGYYNTDIPYGYDEENPQNNWINFNDRGWASFGDPYCAIQKWANVNNIQWDGIARYNKC